MDAQNYKKVPPQVFDFRKILKNPRKQNSKSENFTIINASKRKC